MLDPKLKSAIWESSLAYSSFPIALEWQEQVSHNPLHGTCAMRIVYFNTSGINKSGLAKADDEIVHHPSFWTGFFYKKQTIYEVSNVFIIIAIISIPWPLCRCDISQVTYSGASVPSVLMTALVPGREGSFELSFKFLQGAQKCTYISMQILLDSFRIMQLGSLEKCLISNPALCRI